MGVDTNSRNFPHKLDNGEGGQVPPFFDTVISGQALDLPSLHLAIGTHTIELTQVGAHKH